jgi:hypothetical protein
MPRMAQSKSNARLLPVDGLGGGRRSSLLPVSRIGLAWVPSDQPNIGEQGLRRSVSRNATCGACCTAPGSCPASQIAIMLPAAHGIQMEDEDMAFYELRQDHSDTEVSGALKHACRPVLGGVNPAG